MIILKNIEEVPSSIRMTDMKEYDTGVIVDVPLHEELDYSVFLGVPVMRVQSVWFTLCAAVSCREEWERYIPEFRVRQCDFILTEK